MTDPRDEQIAELRRELEAYEELRASVCQEAQVTECGYYGEDPESALNCIRSGLAAYSQLMWDLMALVGADSAKVDDVRAGVTQKIAALTASRDLARTSRDRFACAIDNAVQKLENSPLIAGHVVRPVIDALRAALTREPDALPTERG